MKLSKRTFNILITGMIIFIISLIVYVVMLFSNVFGGIDITKCIYDPGKCNQEEQEGD